MLRLSSGRLAGPGLRSGALRGRLHGRRQLALARTAACAPSQRRSAVGCISQIMQRSMVRALLTAWKAWQTSVNGRAERRTAGDAGRPGLAAVLAPAAGAARLILLALHHQPG